MAVDLGATTNLFFDSPRVIAAVDVATRRAMSKMGAFVRTRARSSIRKRKKPSPPGSPPSSHVGTLRNLLFFAFDPVTYSVVVGPVLLGRRPDAVPGTLEAGAVVPRVVREPLPAARRATKRQAAAYRRLLKEGRLVRPPVRLRTVAAAYPPRPYMGPALAAEVRAGTITDALRGSIRG